MWNEFAFFDIVARTIYLEGVVMDSINQQICGFDNCSNDIIGNILGQIVHVTTSSIFNKKDIPVIFRNASRLSITCKSIFAKVEDLTTTDIFLKSLSNKYSKPYEYFAARFNTTTSRTWLWKMITRNGDFETYQAIQDIAKITLDIIEEADSAEIQFTQNDWRIIYYTDLQTVNGFSLMIYQAPHYIITPFGKMKIFEGGSFFDANINSRDPSRLISALFMQRLNAVFNRVQTDSDYVEITTTNSDTLKEIEIRDIKKLSYEDVQKKKGTKNLIVCEDSGRPTFYDVRNVNGRHFDAPTKNENKRSRKLINRIWELLEKNRLGLNPIINEIKIGDIDGSNPLFKNVLEVFSFVSNIAKQIDVQPLRTPPNGYFFKTLKWKDNSKEALMEVELMMEINKLSYKLLKGSGWDIGRISYGIHGEGFQLNYKPNINCDIEFLQESYLKILKEVGLNWVKTNLKNQFLTKPKLSEEEYFLFVKKGASLFDEFYLIKLLAKALNLSKEIIPQYDVNRTLLWIKKDQEELVCRAFNMQQD